MKRWWAGWRLAVRLAARDAMKSRGRSLLVLVMVTLPVLAVTVTAVLYATVNVNSKESLDRRLGTVAAADVMFNTPASTIVQGPDPADGTMSDGRPASGGPTYLRTVLGDRPTLRIEETSLVVGTRVGKTFANTYALDPTDPLAAGLFRLTQGRWPSSPDEVVVNHDLAGRGPGLGATLQIDGPKGTTIGRTVVGIAESAIYRTTPVVVMRQSGLDGIAVGYNSVHFLVGGGPVTWPQVQELNAHSGTVLSRAVVLNPPAAALAAMGPQENPLLHPPAQVATVEALVVSMVLLEVILLAGPAFAVGARRQSRTLALLAASGGTPRQMRRIVLASGVVLGGVAAIVGAVVGIGVARITTPIAQSHSGSWFGPFQVPWNAVGGVVVFGLVSALLAAVVPAFVASRQDVVAVLAGRRGDGKPSKASPFIGVGAVALGIVLAWRGAVGDGEFLIAVSAVVCVIGMLFLVPVVVVGVARLGRWLPLSLRFAVRDAARHRTRTVPAVAAVAATVAGVVALGIATASDEQQSRDTYQMTLPYGTAAIADYGDDHIDWTALRQRINALVPGARITTVEGLDGTQPGGGSEVVQFDQLDGNDNWWAGYESKAGASVLVSDGVLPPLIGSVSAGDRAGAEQTLEHGGVVLFGTSAPSTTPIHGAKKVRVTATLDRIDGTQGKARTVTTPAWLIDVGSRRMPLQAVVAPSVAVQLGVTPRTTGLYVDRAPISAAAETSISEAALAQSISVGVSVERGYIAPGSIRALRWLLAALGAALMLGGTLTATSLSLADAQPDLATLAAVGASPRVRRQVAGSFALSIGLVGAVLGALIGFVPGVAISYPLTHEFVSDGPSHYLDVPWTLVLGIVVALPVGVALLVAVATRGRLPLTRRTD